MNWFLIALKKYATFSGRSRRSEFWYFVLFYLIIFCALAFVDRLTGSFDADAGMGLLSGLFALGLIVPNLSVTVRRLHDTNRSGWWVLLSLVPLVGQIVLIVFMAQKGDVGENRFGPDPKEEPLSFPSLAG
ncbi:DUF805 domain-containing protein [Variovorax sp. HJSM1_2]|uniref:DUF805 domain-containing protein n=1 Tax=Variovorax sp. HJSM1_2 TaxID=3366263 RepID=UPI003BE5B91C